MITVIYSTHKDSEYNKKFKKHILETIGVKNPQILEVENRNEYSLSYVYNLGIEISEYDIIVCCHNDIKLEKNWGKKLLEDFSNNPDYGIIGKAGTCYFPESGVYWEKMTHTMVGQVYHQPEGSNKWLSKYSPKLPFIIPVVSIDGVFISFNKTKIKHTFDETIGRFHFYDHGFCVPNYLDGVKLGVTSSFDITHQSVGRPNHEFYVSKELFVKKYGDKFPLDLPPNKIFVPEINEKPLKNIGKMAVIIPTKGKVEMLFDCINSFYQNCNSNLFDIFIADTGSTNEEKEWIKTNILGLGNIKLIEFDYYNFAKINNEVVSNHIGEEYEFLLFCNNDIKLLNNVVYGMLKIFKEKPKTGTIGCRLHFEDNKVQHDGIRLFYNQKNNNLGLTHYGLGNYFNYTTNSKVIVGSTGALLGVRRKSFINAGMFNELYTNCFEDVELNLKLIILGFENMYDGSLVAYHYESLTRKELSNHNETMGEDLNKTLLPFIFKNQQYLNKYIDVIQ
jgi:GT2 family glycosyltransferase